MSNYINYMVPDNYCFDFTESECARKKHGICPFELTQKEREEASLRNDTSQGRYVNAVAYCYELSEIMETISEKIEVKIEKADLGNGGINSGRHRLCIGRKLNKKLGVYTL